MTDVQLEGLVDLASSRMGGEVLFATDEFFAPAERLVRPDAPEWRPDAFTDHGKWMDGWEPRRRRLPGHDWCLLRLASPGELRAVDIDTSHFTGNYPPFASVDACNAPADASVEYLRTEARWTEICPSTALSPSSGHLRWIDAAGPWTHVRLRIYPAGGVARFRVFGRAVWAPEVGEVDLASALRGGRALLCSDMHFSPMEQLILPGPSVRMDDGWETRRRNRDGWDWIVVGLGRPGVLSRLVLDTRHFHGNFPRSASVDGLFWRGAPVHRLQDAEGWRPLLPETPLAADRAHEFDVVPDGPVSHVRLNIRPDGGVARLRCVGRPVSDDHVEAEPVTEYWNRLPEQDAVKEFMRACGSARWARSMAARRPFGSAAELWGWAEEEWWRLDPSDWLEAFSHHPRIGAQELRERFADTAELSQSEQSGVAGATQDVLDALASGNAEYEDKFGHVFLICATGKSADEMLAALRRRLAHGTDEEIHFAAGEQALITRLRLEAMAR